MEAESWEGEGVKDRGQTPEIHTVHTVFLHGWGQRRQGPDQLCHSPEAPGVVSPKGGELQPGGLVGRWHP